MKKTNPSLFLILLVCLGVLAGFPSAGVSEIVIHKTVQVGQNVPDEGDLVSSFLWQNAGLTQIGNVKLRVVMSSPVADDPMALGQMVVTLNHGLPSEASRGAVVLNRRGVTVGNPWGDESSSLDEVFDLGNGLAGSWLASNRWSVGVSDEQAGARARLDSYTATVSSGGALAVAQLSTGNMTLGGGDQYKWEIDDFSGNDGNFLAGQGTNWDFLNTTGTLNVTATSGDKFILDVLSLLPTSAQANLTAGAAGNWDPMKGYSFAIATASGGIQIGGSGLSSFGSESAFDAALGSRFLIQTTGFANAADSAALWSISTSGGGTTMLLNYNGGATAIPEPSSASLLIAGIGGLLALRRRRKS